MEGINEKLNNNLG
uniref:Uncharacterized protein n=1 Tax=Anguilla anguilla TaxID=7936 RepID=A0A0E9Q5U1_ANGAN